MMSWMHPTSAGSWGIGSDFPLELQFWGYIGECEGFHLEAEQPASSLDEIMWRRWWDIFITHSYGRILVEIERTMPGLSPEEQSRRAAARRRHTFDPPAFQGLSGAPALQALAQRYWSPFNDRWSMVGGEKEMLGDMLAAQWRRVDSKRLIRECTRAAGKAINRPFRLYIDFVRWPPGYFRHVSDERLILGKGYLEASQAEFFKQIVQFYICQLV